MLPPLGMHAPRTAPQLDRPVFSTPVRWALRGLSWLAFLASAYLAWHVVNQTPVAGCGVGAENGCDVVLGSSWSKWLGVPVAIPGLACYATLATLSVLLGMRNVRAARWLNTAFVMLGALAAIASLWFLAIQVLAIGHFCRFCIVADACGIAIGAIALWSAARWLHETRYARKSHIAATGLMALRTALPATKRAVPATAPREYPAPSLAIALGGATAIALMLIGGQIVFPAKSYQVEQVALSEAIEMNGANADEPGEPNRFEPDTRVAMRVPAEQANDGKQNSADNPAESGVVAAGYEEQDRSADANGTPPANAPDGAAKDDGEEPTNGQSYEPGGKRLVKFLNGQLTLDVYKHPLIGSPDAPHVIVEMVSYNCQHCRNTHRRVKQALSRYGDQVAIIIMVIPFERECNKLITTAAASHRGACSTARMALGVAALKPSAFAKFHDWLMADKENPPELDSIVSRAYTLVNRERLRELSGGEQLRKQIAGYINLFATLRNQHSGDKEFGLPVQILGDHVVSGTVEKASDMYGAWEKYLGVKPR
jgi:uncharacterized membrane protein